MRTTALSFALLIVTSFFLHLGWENTHVGLYRAYDDLSRYLPVAVWATLGDVFYTLGVVLFFVLLRSDMRWVTRAGKRDFAALAAAGFFVALFVEYKAAYFGLWHYRDAMPMVPFLNIGLTPVIQMTVLLPLSVFLAKFLSTRYNKTKS